jgi:hypothetical protein
MPQPFPRGGQFSESRTDWPLLTRGWVLQERILAPRVIHYARDQLYWECDSRFLDEYGQYEWRFEDSASANHSFENGITPLKDRSVDPHRYWRNMISLYTNLAFTYRKDVLPALAGIVEREMRYRKDDVYIAGMWEKGLLEDLAFHIYETYKIRKNCQAPTWSWASMEGPIGFLNVQQHPSVSLVKLDYERTAPANIGYVSNASLRIRGPVLSVRFEAHTSKPPSLKPSQHDLPAQTINAISNIRIQHPRGPDFPRYFTEDINRNLKIMVLSSYDQFDGSSAILLEPVSTGEVPQYRKLDAVYVKYRHEVGQAYSSTGKYVDQHENDVERARIDETYEADGETASISSQDSYTPTNGEGTELMIKLIDLLPIQEVEII